MDFKQILVDFVEGRLSFSSFHTLVMSDDNFSQWIDKSVPSDWCCYSKPTAENNYQGDRLPFSVRQKFEGYARQTGLNSIGYRLNIHGTMTLLAEYLYPTEALQPDPSIERLYDLITSACPSYIDGPEVWKSGILESIAAECSTEWSKAQKKKHIKTRIVEEFHLEGKNHPRWMQNPDWPFANGKPMKYVRTTIINKNEWYQHHFIDLETGEERIVDDMT